MNSKRKTNWSPPKHKPQFSSENTVWYNSVFRSDISDDECSSVGSNTILSSHIATRDANENSCFAMQYVNEEELKLREELAREIEAELEREIMEGILVLVHRLSDLKAKQITRGLKDLHLDQFVSELYSSNCCTLCKIGGQVVSPRSPASNGSWVFGENMGEQACAASDMESTTEKWSCRSTKELKR